MASTPSSSTMTSTTTFSGRIWSSRGLHGGWIWSARGLHGGVGKTTTTANLAVSLAPLSLPAVAVDADAGLRNLDLLLGLENRVHLTAADVH